MCPRIVKDRELCTETVSFCVRAQFRQKGLTRSVQLNKTNDWKLVLNYIVFLLLHHKTGIQYFSREHRDNGHIWQSLSLTAENNIWHPIYCAILGHLHQNGCARWSASLLMANSKLCPPKMAFLWKSCWESLQQMLPKLPFNKPANQILTIWYIEQEFAKELLNVRSNIIRKTKTGKMTLSDGKLFIISLQRLIYSRSFFKFKEAWKQITYHQCKTTALRKCKNNVLYSM